MFLISVSPVSINFFKCGCGKFNNICVAVLCFSWTALGTMYGEGLASLRSCGPERAQEGALRAKAQPRGPGFAGGGAHRRRSLPFLGLDVGFGAVSLDVLCEPGCSSVAMKHTWKVQSGNRALRGGGCPRGRLLSWSAPPPAGNSSHLQFK